MGLTINSNFTGVAYGASSVMKSFQGTMGKSLKKISTGKAYAGGGGGGVNAIKASVKYKTAAGKYEAEYYKVQQSAASQAIKIADLESRMEASMAVAASIILGAPTMTTQGVPASGATGAASDMAASLASAYDLLNQYDYSASYYQNMAGAAESAYAGVTDTDMAMEMSKYVKANVGAQAAQAMVAQANQSMASILSLLQ